jgi:hypothetical protein
VNRVLRTTILAACLPVSLLVGATKAAETQLRVADSTGVVIRNAAPAAIADFDQNGIADRVDASNASGRTNIWLTLNGRQRIILAEASEASRLLVLDIDHDADADLVALTTTGRLLVWRNQSGALRLVQPKENSDVPRSGTSLRDRAQPPDSLLLNDRDLPFTVSAGQTHALPFGLSRIAVTASQRRVAGSNPSASRSPPAC